MCAWEKNEFFKHILNDFVHLMHKKMCQQFEGKDDGVFMYISLKVVFKISSLQVL